MIEPGSKRSHKAREPRPPKDPNLRNKMYKFRLYPTQKQSNTLDWILRRAKELYNAALEERTAAYRMCGISVSYQMQADQLPEIKEERPEYQGIYSQVLQDVLRRMDKAMQNFFRRVREGQKPGYPRFKSIRRYHSFTYPQDGYNIIGKPTNLKKNETKTCRLALSKIGHIKMVMHRSIHGTIKTCSIKREGDQWYAIFGVEYKFDPTMAFHPSTEEVGIDVGIKSYAVLSNGEQIANPRIYRSTEQQIKAAHRQLARRSPGSHRRNRAKQELSRLYRKSRHRRHDFLHKASRQLVATYDTLVFEDLQIANLVARPKPKQDEETGKYLPNGATTKGGLNKSILDAAWGTFMHLCASKAEEAGCTVAKVPPHYSSQLCSVCGALVPKDLSVRWHSCPECGTELDRDENSARIHLERYRQRRDAQHKQHTPKKKKEVSAGAGSAPQEPALRGERRASCRSPRL